MTLQQKLFLIVGESCWSRINSFEFVRNFAHKDIKIENPASGTLEIYDFWTSSPFVAHHQNHLQIFAPTTSKDLIHILTYSTQEEAEAVATQLVMLKASL